MVNQITVAHQKKNTLIKSERWPTNPFTPTRNCCTWELISRARQSISFRTKFVSSLLLKEVKSHAHQLWLGTWCDVGWPVSGSPLWSPHGLAEGICRIRGPTCSEPKVIQFIWVCCFSANCLIIPISSKLHQYCLMKRVWSTVLPVQVAFSVSKYRRIYSSTCYRIWWAT